jgi:hypothetical protein
MSRSKSDASRLKKILAIVGASILALSGIVKLVKDNAVEQHAVIVAANERYTNYLTQSTISLQILLREIEETNEKVKSLQAKPGRPPDYLEVINRNVDASMQFYADLNRNADEASKLIDALPSSYQDLRNQRDETAKAVESTHTELSALIAKKSDLPTRYRETQLFAEKTVLIDANIIKFGDRAMTAADETIELQDRKIKALGLAVNILIPLAALFGLFAAFWGVKVEGGDD